MYVQCVMKSSSRMSCSLTHSNMWCFISRLSDSACIHFLDIWLSTFIKSDSSFALNHETSNGIYYELFVWEVGFSLLYVWISYLAQRELKKKNPLKCHLLHRCFLIGDIIKSPSLHEEICPVLVNQWSRKKNAITKIDEHSRIL